MEFNLKTFIFIYDQLYIILSQLINIQKIKILFFKKRFKKSNNIIYLKILF